MNNEVLVKVEQVSKKYCTSLKRSLRYGIQDIANEFRLWGNGKQAALRPDEFWGLKDVSFELRRGEALGLIGANGAGKSTLLKLLNGLIKPDAGQITMRGRVGALIELGAGFNPVLTGRENIYINAAVLGQSKTQVDGVIDEIIEFSGIREFIDTPVRNYSSGMWTRLGYAIAAHLNPDVLLVDEVLAVGDLAFRRKCLQHMQTYLKNGGSLVLVSHSIYLMQSICQRALFINRGEVVFDGPTVEAADLYFKSQQLVSHKPSGKQADDEEHSELSEQNGAAADQWHDLDDEHPIAIDKVEMTAVDGDEIYTGDSASITISYRSIKAIDEVFWGFMIWTKDQVVCITSDLKGLSNDTYQVVKGRGRFRCTIPQLPLIAGTYALKTVIGDSKTKMLLARSGWDDAPAFFSVRAAMSETNNLLTGSGSIVKVEVEWEE